MIHILLNYWLHFATVTIVLTTATVTIIIYIYIYINSFYCSFKTKHWANVFLTRVKCCEVTQA